MTEEKKKKFRPFRALGRFTAALLLLIYVLVGFSAASAYFKTALNRLQDIKELPFVIQRAVLNNDPEDVSDWVRLRPMRETDDIIKAVMPMSGDLEPGVFLDLSRREALRGRTEEALFWAQYARFRYRFDVLRCGIAKGTDITDNLMEAFSSPVVDELLIKKPELVKKSVTRVLDFDGQYPARNRPDFICRIVGRLMGVDPVPVSPDQWESMRQMLHYAAEGFLKEDNGKK